MGLINNLSITLAILASLVAVLYKPLSLRIEVLGVTRPLESIENIHGHDLRVIQDTLYTEDLHHHAPSGLLFGASEEKAETRWNWFPAMGKFDTSYATDHGTIIVIDPKTKTTTRLTLPNFPHPFITHGIDLHSPPATPNKILIYAINHLANPAYIASSGAIPPAARSQIELFEHTIGTTTAIHLRSIYHPLIRTPNDVYAIDSNNIYVSNDHRYRSGRLRTLEDVGFGLTPWSDIVHITLSSLQSSDPSESLTATIALSNIQNPNGLGHGKDSHEILICRAAAGVMEIAHPGPEPGILQIHDTLQMPNTLDNPSYFHDPFAKTIGRDASGYVLSGLVRASNFPSKQDPIVVWLVQRSSGAEKFEKKKIFQDDGRAISTVSTAVLVAIDPAANEGKKQAWLFVTGPRSLNAVSTKIDL